MALSPIRSVFEFHVREGGGPDVYMFNIGGPLGTLQGTFDFQLFFLCRFHHSIYADLDRQNAHLDQQYERHKPMIDKSVSGGIDEDEVDAWLTVRSRVMDAILAQEDEIRRVKHLADDYVTIGLWATAEQFLGRVLVGFESKVRNVAEADVAPAYKWNHFCDRYASLNIDLATLNGFHDADECRVLNNTIKHAGYVDDRLAQYAFFASHNGSALSEIDFEMQRYLNGVSNFVGSLIAEASRIVDPTFKF